MYTDLAEHFICMVMMVMKQGTASVKSEKSIFIIGFVINTPTKTKAGVVAAEGMMRKSGEKNKATKKSRATVNEVSPVRPPSAMPVALST